MSCKPVCGINLYAKQCVKNVNISIPGTKASPGRCETDEKRESDASSWTHNTLGIFSKDAASPKTNVSRIKNYFPFFFFPFSKVM